MLVMPHLLEHLHSAHGVWVEVERFLGVDRHADFACFRVHAEWRLQQVVHLLGHLQIQAGIRVAKYDVARHAFQRRNVLPILVALSLSEQDRPIVDSLYRNT